MCKVWNLVKKGVSFLFVVYLGSSWNSNVHRRDFFDLCVIPFSLALYYYDTLLYILIDSSCYLISSGTQCSTRSVMFIVKLTIGCTHTHRFSFQWSTLSHGKLWRLNRNVKPTTRRPKHSNKSSFRCSIICRRFSPIAYSHGTASPILLHERTPVHPRSLTNATFSYYSTTFKTRNNKMHMKSDGCIQITKKNIAIQESLCETA